MTPTLRNGTWDPDSAEHELAECLESYDPQPSPRPVSPAIAEWMELEKEMVA